MNVFRLFTLSRHPGLPRLLDQVLLITALLTSGTIGATIGFFAAVDVGEVFVERRMPNSLLVSPVLCMSLMGLVRIVGFWHLVIRGTSVYYYRNINILTIAHT